MLVSNEIYGMQRFDTGALGHKLPLFRVQSICPFSLQSRRLSCRCCGTVRQSVWHDVYLHCTGLVWTAVFPRSGYHLVAITSTAFALPNIRHWDRVPSGARAVSLGLDCAAGVPAVRCLKFLQMLMRSYINSIVVYHGASPRCLAWQLLYLLCSYLRVFFFVSCILLSAVFRKVWSRVIVEESAACAAHFLGLVYDDVGLAW